MSLQINELHKKDSKELKNLLREYRAELYTLKFKASTGQLETTHKIKALKKDIARVLTVINQKLQNKVLLAKTTKKVLKETQNSPETQTKKAKKASTETLQQEKEEESANLEVK